MKKKNIITMSNKWRSDNDKMMSERNIIVCHRIFDDSPQHHVVIVWSSPIQLERERSHNSPYHISALKALLDGWVRLGESQVRLAESKCWWKELRLHVGGSVSLTLSQDGYHSVVLIAHDSIGQKIKCYLALIFAHGDTITFIAATVGA